MERSPIVTLPLVILNRDLLPIPSWEGFGVGCHDIKDEQTILL